jgi:hypothetical protein
VNVVRVPWSSASFLVYLGGITILFATVAFAALQAENHGDAGFVLWALLILVAVSAAALVARATGHSVTAGVLAVTWVVAILVFVGAVLEWFGWLPDDGEGGVFEGFRFWLLVFEIVAISTSAVALRLFRFPLLVLFLAAFTWFFVTDLISGGGGWSAIVTIAIGLTFLLAAIAVDDGPSRPFGFWLHVASGLTIGGGLLWFFNDGDFDWIVTGVVGLAYIAVGDRLQRSSWVVLGAFGILLSTAHFAEKWSDPISLVGFGAEREHEWLAPLLFVAVGAFFIGIALWFARRRRETIAGADLL